MPPLPSALYHSPPVCSIYDVYKEGPKQMTIRQKLAQFAQYRQTIRELSALDNHQLKDLGITRADIKNIARGPAL